MDRGMRIALESGRPVAQVARDLGIGHEALRKRVRQAEAEADGGLRPDLPSSEEREEIRKLSKEVFELCRANEILKAASVFFATRRSEVSAFVDRTLNLRGGRLARGNQTLITRSAACAAATWS